MSSTSRGSARSVNAARLASVLGDNDDQQARPLPPWRVILGWACGALALLVLMLAVLGTWNPRHNVAIREWLGNPVALTAIALWLLVAFQCLAVPVRREAAQNTRAWLRIISSGLALLSIVVFMATRPTFGEVARPVARTADGQRTAVVVYRATDALEQYGQLHIRVGTGWSTVDAGSFGRYCATIVKVTFRGAGELAAETSYGDWTLRLDAKTGAPLDRINENCTKPPTPR